MEEMDIRRLDGYMVAGLRSEDVADDLGYSTQVI
jgi:hypothetical protein